MASKGQKFRKYSIEVKKAVVNEYLEKNTPLLELAYKYHVASQESILQWIKNYKLRGEDSFNDKRGSATRNSAPLKGRPKEKFATEEEKEEYLKLVAERNKVRAAEKRRLTKLRKKREAKREQERLLAEQYQAHLGQ